MKNNIKKIESATKIVYLKFYFLCQVLSEQLLKFKAVKPETRNQKPETVYLLLGSNQGDSQKTLNDAIESLKKLGFVNKISSIYKTAAWGFEGADFLNVCVGLQTSLSPQDLLIAILKIETQLGRKRDVSKTYQDRTIDIDILLFEDEVIDTDKLIVPHPKLLDRRFALVPLNEIAASTKHPIAGDTIASCLKRCSDEGAVYFFSGS